MNRQPIAVLTFIGDITRDSRALRYIDGLRETHSVIALTASGEEIDRVNPSYRLLSIPSMRSGSFRSAVTGYFIRARRILRMLEPDICIASDLYTLPAAAAAVARGSKLVYDSRELYSSIAALHDRPLKQKFWSWVESNYAPKSSLITTVNESIARILRQKYPASRVEVIHNYPVQGNREDSPLLRLLLKVPDDKKILLSQGGLQKGRGGENLVRVMSELQDCVLVFLGSGPIKRHLRDTAVEIGVADRIHFIDAVPAEELPLYTASADIGLCLIEDLGLSYRLSLPNKLFEYIAAGLPVIGSDLPEIRRVIEDCGVGLVVQTGNLGAIGESIRRLCMDRAFFDICAAASRKARLEFDWRNERGKLIALIDELADGTARARSDQTTSTRL